MSDDLYATERISYLENVFEECFSFFLPSLTLKILKITSTMKAGAISLLCNIGRIKEKISLYRKLYFVLKKGYSKF